MKNRGFTDRLYFLNLVLVWAFILIGIIATFLESRLGISDLSVFNYGIPCAFTELGVHTGFIITKATKENLSKFGENEDG